MSTQQTNRRRDLLPSGGTLSWLLALLILCVVPTAGSGHATGASERATARAATASVVEPHSRLSPNIATAIDLEITAIEKEIMEAADAMPEARFNFSPDGLKISGADFQGVRTFAVQVKHVAASNYALWSGLTGDKIPEDFRGGDGPGGLQSKADILKFLEDSFALGHRAAATLTPQNMLQTVGSGESSRLHLATFAVAHANDHYGQMVEYLRMNGIVPPASR